MRLVQYRHEDKERLGRLEAGRIIDLQLAAVEAGRNPTLFASTRALLEADDEFLDLARTLQHASPISAEDVTFATPIRSGKILAIGLNYRDHAAEAGQALPETPLCFAKFPSCLAGPFDDIELPAEDAQVDYEAELGVVIGKRTRRVSEQAAMACVTGYVAFNDVSARRWQFADGQWVRGKSCDTFGPCGPCLVTADEIAHPGNLGIRAFLNGELVQSSNTDQMIFSVAALVSYLSQAITLEPGDLIATGTPAGIGFTRKPQRLLEEGDVIEVEIDGIGRIRNRVVQNW